MERLNEYKYFLNPETGQTQAIDRRTGEIHDTVEVVVPSGSKVVSPAQQRQNEKIKQIRAEQKERNLQRKLYRKVTGKRTPPFTFVSLGADFSDISPASLTRLIYLSTYLSYHNSELRISERKKIKHSDLPDILGISLTTTSRFWAEVSPTFLDENTQGELILNADIFVRGSLQKLLAFYMKVFADGMKKLYDETPNAQHKHLGYIFALLRFVNTEHNILCHNTDEKELEKIQPMSMKEFCAEIGFNYRHVHRLHESFKIMKFDEGEGRKELFCSIVRNIYNGKELMVINPKVFYSGHNAAAVAELGVFY